MADNLYCYYTPVELAICLLKLIATAKIYSAVDICCGKGALLKAAQEVFPDCKLTGVDIVDDGINKFLGDCTFFMEDGFEYVNNHKNISFDLILSNPPFGRTNKKNIGNVSELNRKRLECQMMNANLDLMHQKSWMLIILPSTFIVGSSYIKARKEIATYYKIYGIVQLPEDTFGTRYIKTFAVLLNGKIDNKPVKIYSARHGGKDWELIDEGEVSFDRILVGDWYGDEKKLEMIDITIFRGAISSTDFTEKGIDVYHNAGKQKKEWKPSIRHVKSKCECEKKAKKGDIIINRVGRSCGYWCVCERDDVLVSDCIYVIRKKRGIIKCLKQISINGRLDVEQRGVATKYITKEDIVYKLSSVWGNIDY